MTYTTASARDPSRVEFIILVAALMALNALAIDVMLPALPYMGEALG
ncbi:MAG: MFS transporter, partial [Alphaproteobacteria bacterium]